MNHGVCLLATIAMRAEPSHRSELVNQLIFGDLYEVLETKGEWLFICLQHDGYKGWINANQANFIDSEEFETLKHAPYVLSADLVHLLKNRTTGASLMIGAGCKLYFFDNQSASIAGMVFEYLGQVIIPKQSVRALMDNASLFLDVPYFWGGRTPMGIDCSGLMQLVFLMSGFELPRDASQQALIGEDLHLVSQAKPGDLVFFGSPDKAISHVGMVVDEGQLIHAFGKVRIDPVDHLGIFNKELNRYTHYTRLVKRVAPRKE